MTAEDPTDTASALARARHHLAPYRRALLVLAVISAITAALESGIIVALVPLAQAVAGGDDEYSFTLVGREWTMSVTALVVLILGLAVGRLVAGLATASRTGTIVARYQTTQRRELLGGYLDASWPVQAREAAGRLQDTATFQVERGTAALGTACLTLTALSTLLILLVAAVAVNVLAALSIIVAGVLLFFITRPLATLAERNSRQLIGNNQDFAAHVEQSVDLARELRVFESVPVFRRRLDSVVEGARSLRARQTRLLLTLPTVYQNLAILLVVVGLGIIHWRELGEVTALATIVLLLVRALAYSQVVQVQYHQLVEALPYLDSVESKRDEYAAARVDTTSGADVSRVESVAFDRVDFTYDESDSGIRDITFDARRGDVVGIIGPSGTGKSTVVQLLLGLRRPTAGTIRVNGDDLATIALRSWHARIGFVPQEPQLLEGPVEQNIRFFRDDLTDEQVVAAAERAQIHDRIRRWPEGYDTPVRDFGGRMSGGERQRLCLARALATDPDVLVFDEPTSSLDPSSADAVHQSLRELADEFLLFLVAHDPRSLQLCTKVLVLVDGHVEYFGPVDEAARGSRYVRSLPAASGSGRLPR